MTEAINSWLTGLVSGAALPAAQLAGSLLDPTRLSGSAQIHQLWAGSQAAANTLYLLFIVAGGIILLGHESMQTQYAVKEILPRLLLGWVAANLSWWVITTLTQLAAALAIGVAGSGVAPAEVLARLVVSVNLDGPVFLIILLGVVTVITFILVLTLIVVAVGVLLMTVLAPLALCLHALPHTEAVAWLWWRTLAALLAIPTLQALLLALISRVLLSPGGLTPLTPGSDPRASLAGGLLNGLVVIALLYFMVKIPGWVLRQATGRTGGGGMIKSLVRTALLTAGLSAIGAGPLAGIAARGGGPRAVLGSLLGTRLRAARGPQHTRPTRQAGGPAPVTQGDPYAAVRALPGGQLMLPLHGLRRTTRPNRPRSADVHTVPPGDRALGKSASRRSGRVSGRQLRLPLGQQWPEHRPVLGPGGQYQLPLPGITRTRPTPTGTVASTSGSGSAGASVAGRRGGGRTGHASSAAAVGRSTTPARARARQLTLPLTHGWPENRPVLGRDGQYRLPITVTRVRPTPRPTPAPLTAPSPPRAPHPPAPSSTPIRTAPSGPPPPPTPAPIRRAEPEVTPSPAAPTRAPGPGAVPGSGRVRRVRRVPLADPELPLIWPSTPRPTPRPKSGPTSGGDAP